jgi:hypothetical protein
MSAHAALTPNLWLKGTTSPLLESPWPVPPQHYFFVAFGGSNTTVLLHFYLCNPSLWRRDFLLQTL